ncbi:MAG: glycosyltransferase family 2 protein [Caldilineales bacterium]|nr:glycosyltransferase family 2 protein [Caldilineales bacterium]
MNSGVSQQNPTNESQVPCDISVICVNWNALSFLPAALESLFAAQGDMVVEVWVVDNASTDGSVAWLRRHYPQVHVLANTENRGFAAANNQGITRARGRYLLLLNPDTELPTTALQRMWEFMEQHPQVGAMGPRLLGVRGKIQGGAAGYDPGPATIFNYATFLYRLFPRRLRGLWLPQSTYLKTDPISVDWISGACMMVRASAAATVGPLDESYFMYSEDAEWCRRMRARGFEIVCHPGISVVHHIGGSSRQLGPDFYAHNVDSLDWDLRRRYSGPTVAFMHLIGAFGFLLRYLLYEAQWLRWRNPAFAELRDLWAACLRTSLKRVFGAAVDAEPQRFAEAQAKANVIAS